MRVGDFPCRVSTTIIRFLAVTDLLIYHVKRLKDGEGSGPAATTSQQSVTPSSAGPSEPSPFGPSAFPLNSVQPATATGSGALLAGPPGAPFAAPLQPQQERYGFAAPGPSPFPTSTFYPSIGQGVGSSSFGVAHTAQQPAEDAFAAIAQEALRSSPKSPRGPKPRGERARTSSIGSEGGEKSGPDITSTADVKAPVSVPGPQGGLGNLYPTIDAGVSGVALKEGPHVAVETLPGSSQQLPPLPEVPVAFEPKKPEQGPPVATDPKPAYQPSHLNAPGKLESASAAQAAPPTTLHPPVVVAPSAAQGTEQVAKPPADWDSFFADRRAD